MIGLCSFELTKRLCFSLDCLTMRLNVVRIYWKAPFPTLLKSIGNLRLSLRIFFEELSILRQFKLMPYSLAKTVRKIGEELVVYRRGCRYEG